MNPFYAQRGVPRDRLEGLMLFRVVLVTLFLGSAIAIDAPALASLSSFKNATLLSLIIGTYGATIVYALAFRQGVDRRLFAIVQLLADTATVAILTAVTGGLDSPFLILFHLTVINAAVVAGRETSLFLALAVAICLATLAASQAGWLDESKPIAGSGAWRTIGFRFALSASGAFLVAILGGYLADRLGEATRELERRQVDIQELRALNENILASLSSGLLTIDDEGRVIFFNAAAENITGWSRKEILGKPLEDVFPDFSDTLRGNGRSGFSDGRREIAYETPAGDILHLGFSISPLYNASHAAVGQIVIFQDLSDIRELEEQMRRAERLAAVGQLAASIAHEIRNPLASISGSVELLEASSSTSDDERALMRIVLREVDRLNKLISEFLEYSRPRQLHLVESDVEALVREVVGLFQHRQTDGLRVDLQVADLAEAPRPCVDEEALRQVVWNLLNNALEATASSDGEHCITVSVDHLDRRWRIAVEDSGPGVSAEAIEHIFEPFFTTKPQGSGLGLATSYRIIQDHHGQLLLDASPQLGGARFEIHLPSKTTSDITEATV